MRSTGLANEKANEATEMSVPLAIICASEGRVPSTDIVDMVYAEIIDSSIMISICCTADNKVHRPCRMMSTHALIDGVRVVNGAAVEASPNWTIGVSSIESISPAHFAAPAANALPCFFCICCCSFEISFRNLLTTVDIATMWPLTPVSSPRFRRASISSSIHSCCLDIRSRFFRAISSCAFFDIACAFCACSLRCSARASSASLTSSGLANSFSPRPTLALPKPLRSARPTSASFKAPTSLPPSPHIKANACSLLRTALMTCSFCQGDSRAKIWTATSWRRTASASDDCKASSRPRPVMTKSWEARKAVMPAGSKDCESLLATPVVIAGTHSSCPVSPFSCRTNASVEGNSQIPTSWATLNAVRGASPVSITALCLESWSALITSMESFRVSHLKEMKPAKVISLSLASRGFCAQALASAALASKRLKARARTRWPFSAMARYVASYHSGFDDTNLPIASGEPLVKQYAPEAAAPVFELILQIVLIRCSSEEKWKRCSMHTCNFLASCFSCLICFSVSSSFFCNSAFSFLSASTSSFSVAINSFCEAAKSSLLLHGPGEAVPVEGM
mmetsp:Transcript_62322/g.190447  ORF Transcript_62322/g.190447 Transcript_62322/m.190447 type:complete len:567 (+) Transcript_62322:848-2548(+)